MTNFDEAIILSEENTAFMNAIPRLTLLCQCLQIACYAFMGDIEKLTITLPETFTAYNVQTKYFFRFYFAIHAFYENRLEHAYRELENLRHLTSDKKEVTRN